MRLAKSGVNVKIYHCDGETRAKIGRFVTCIFSAIRITIVNR